ncbi:hypothetical protein M1R94_06825 [Actinotalea sp. K2]|nr:hypothetical protein [Actinotalea sp. K2]
MLPPPELLTALASRGLHLAGPLGSGGQGVRWSVRDASGTRWAVTPVVPRSPGHADRIVERVRRLETVVHPHLARMGQVLRLGEGDLAVLHEPVEGTDLATAHLVRTAWSPGEVVTVLVPVAGALAALHEADLCHGDVSPSNIVLTPDGRAVLVDLVLGDDESEGGTPGFALADRDAGASAAGDVHALASVGLHLLDDAGGIARAEAGQGHRGSAAHGADERLRSLLHAVVAAPPGPGPCAAGLATEIYGACPAEPVTAPDPAVLARVALRRLVEPGEPAVTSRRACRGAWWSRGSSGRPGSPGSRAGGGRHRRGRSRAPVLLVVSTMLLVVCAATVGARVTSVRDSATGDRRDGEAATRSVVQVGPGAPSSPVVHPVPAAVELTRRRAAALGARDSEMLAQVTVPGSSAAWQDEGLLRSLLRHREPLTVVATVGRARLVDPGPLEGGSTRSDAVQVRVTSTTTARVRPAGLSWISGTSGPSTVVLTLRPDGDSWRVSEVRQDGA